VAYLANFCGTVGALAVSSLNRLILRQCLKYRGWMYEAKPGLFTKIWASVPPWLMMAGTCPPLRPPKGIRKTVWLIAVSLNPFLLGNTVPCPPPVIPLSTTIRIQFSTHNLCIVDFIFFYTKGPVFSAVEGAAPTGPVRRASRPAVVKYGFMRQSRPQLYTYQGVLPNLPVPHLDDTCRRYLRTVKVAVPSA